MALTKPALLGNALKFFLMIICGVLIAMYLVKSKEPLQHTDTRLIATPVSTLTVKRLPFRAQATGYGNVEPSISFKSKAQVSGKIQFIHPNLQSGQSIKAGTVVVKIDDSDYQVSLQKSLLDIDSKVQSLKQIEEQEKSTLRSLALSQQNLAVGQQEYARIQKIYKKKLAAKATLDKEQQNVIALRQSVENLQGEINGYNSRKAAAQAAIDIARRQAENDRNNLSRTQITLPFNARISDVPIEQGEFISVGEVLFEALDVAAVEIDAQLPIDSVSRLVFQLGKTAPLVQDNSVLSAAAMLSRLQWQASVSLVGGASQATWPAEVLRLGEAIDPTRRTLGVVVGLDNPYAKIIPGVRPPLLKGMYTEVTISTPLTDAIVIPRSALHEGRVYKLGQDNSLEISPVNVLFLQNDLAVISEGLTDGEQIIVNDLFPVIEGMPLQAIPAIELERQLAVKAKGE